MIPYLKNLVIKNDYDETSNAFKFVDNFCQNFFITNFSLFFSKFKSIKKKSNNVSDDDEVKDKMINEATEDENILKDVNNKNTRKNLIEFYFNLLFEKNSELMKYVGNYFFFFFFYLKIFFLKIFFFLFLK